MSGVRSSRNSARASGSAFCPTTAQVAPAPPPGRLAPPPKALGSFAAPTTTCRALDSRRCRRGLSNEVLNCPSPSMTATRPASAASCSVSLSPASTPLIRAWTRGSRTGQLQEHDLIDPAAPAGAGPLTEATPGEQPGLVVIGPEVGAARVWNVDGDEWDVCLEILRGDRGSDGLISLELDDADPLLSRIRCSAFRRATLGWYRLLTTMSSMSSDSAAA